MVRVVWYLSQETTILAAQFYSLSYNTWAPFSNGSAGIMKCTESLILLPAAPGAPWGFSYSLKWSTELAKPALAWQIWWHHRRLRGHQAISMRHERYEAHKTKQSSLEFSEVFLWRNRTLSILFHSMQVSWLYTKPERTFLNSQVVLTLFSVTTSHLESSLSTAKAACNSLKRSPVSLWPMLRLVSGSSMILNLD